MRDEEVHKGVYLLQIIYILTIKKMIDLSGDYIRHLPEKLISREDSLCLGYCDNWDYWLVFEEWELRIYNYEWWSYDTCRGEHWDEDWWACTDCYFEWTDGCLDKITCEYMSLKFENTNPEWMAYEIWEACDNLEDRYSISDWNDEWPNDKLVNFIKEHSMNRAYCYYK